MYRTETMAAGYPFISDAFLAALGACEATGGNSDWQPCHAELAGSWMPMWLRRHSWGEYVFDHVWAHAYARHGLDWYPKLVTAIPYTPVPGPRWRGSDPDPQALMTEVEQRMHSTGASSWHLLFPDQHTREHLSETGLIERQACHFRWFNRDYRDWDDFLAALTSRRRKSIRKERQAVQEQGLEVRRAIGAAIPEHWWQPFYEFYAATYYKRGQAPYLGPAFFQSLRQSAQAEQLVLVMAFRDEQPVAAAFYLFDEGRLYGRYWGCLAEYHALHFELCYYQGIELAIERGIPCFDPGVQGEHKILRGFEPVITWSLHAIREPAFADAIARFCADEARAVAAYQEEARGLLPFRKGD